jgi:phytoene dehydrogenase-like protein
VRDVVVVGAGHNGLVAACYLARAGLDVEVVERRAIAGGAVATVEAVPGYRMDVGSSAHIMVRHTDIPDELALGELGLAYHDLDPWGFAPFGEQAIAFYADLDATCESIAAVCGDADANTYRAFVADWAARNERVFAAFAQPPARAPRHLLGLGRDAGVGGLELTRQFLTSADALLDAHFTDERLKTALAWLAAQAGPPPHGVATADLLGWNALHHTRPPGHPRGGSGALSQALAARLAALGGTLRLGDGARRIAVRDGRAGGVITDSGEPIAARAVVAACHVLTTFDLVGTEPAVGAAWLALARRARATLRTGGGLGMVVRLACDRLPAYPAAMDGAEHRGLQLLCPDRATLRAAHGDFVAGRTPARPPALAMTFSAFDDTLAPPGSHTVSVWGQWHPRWLATGQDWAAIAEREADKLVAAVEAAAPGFADGIRARVIQTPADIEAELGMIDGQVMHLDMTLDQMFAWRPLPELADYRTPAEGLYLTGASTHPGGGVFGASGRSTAHTVLADLGPRRRRRRRPRR